MRAVLVLGALCAAMIAIAMVGASGAKADPVGFKLDRGVIDLNGPEGTWAKIIDPDLTPPDDPAQINSDVASDGTLSAAAGDFSFPPKRIEGLETGNSLLPVVDANIAISASGAISGNYDDDTGETTIDLPTLVEITVYPAGSPAAVARCKIDGFSLALSTSGSITDPATETTYEAAPFAPPSGEGALLATWESLPASQVVSGALAGIVCPALDGMLGGPGGIWFSGTASPDVTPGPPTMMPLITEKPDSSTDSTSATFKFEADPSDPVTATGFECSIDDGAFTDCSSGEQAYQGLSVGNHKFQVRGTTSGGAGPVAAHLWKVTEGPGPGGPQFGALTVKPKAKKVKRGKSVTLVAKVKNVGDAAATGVKICVKAPKKLVRVKKCVTKGSLAAGKTATARFKVVVPKKAKRGKKATLKFTASGKGLASKSARAVIRVG